ncbi:MAG: nuclear transport factor 2 family protein [Sphingomonadales bacterium]|nr:nuclear transport factor 2 family protein [Sphingomonadales bacterium]
MAAEDLAEIVNLINFYPIAVDSQQWQLFDRIFTDDIEADFGGPAVWRGLAPLKQAFAAIHAPFASTQHATRGHHVALDGSDAATCLSYVHGRFIREMPDADSMGGNMFESIGWYDDSLVRTAAGWRIARRCCRTQWCGGNPAVLQTAPEVNVEHVLNSLRTEVQAGRIGHFQALAGL